MKKAPGPVLAIGGIDPSGHAGLFADVRVFEKLGLPYRVAATAITAQSEKKFLAWQAVDPKLLRAQLEAAGPKLSGLKIGMLGAPAQAREVLRWLKKNRPPWVVWDPVWRSSTGADLFRGKPREILELLPFTNVWTPNVPEAELFLGTKIQSLNEARTAALALFYMGKKKSRFVVLKGGHLKDKHQAIDLLAEASGIHELKGKRFKVGKRGSGCTFASALLAALVLGKTPLAAVGFAKSYVKDALFA